MLRALCEENQGCNQGYKVTTWSKDTTKDQVAPGPTSSAPFSPAIISVVIILKGQLTILLKHPKLNSKSTQILYVKYIFETSDFAYTVHLLYFNNESYLSIYRVKNIFMPKFTLILINLKYILYFIIQLQ